MDTVKHYEHIIESCNKLYNEEFSTGEYCHEVSFRWGFEQGYSLAEKEMALIWEDIWQIVHDYLDVDRTSSPEEREPKIMCEKVLQKFFENKNC